MTRMLPPQLSAEARKEALEKAMKARQARSVVKAQLKAGELSLDDVVDLAKEDEAIARMRAEELLVSMPGIGKAKAAAILEQGNISQSRRIGGLGPRQLAFLRDRFGK